MSISGLRRIIIGLILIVGISVCTNERAAAQPLATGVRVVVTPNRAAPGSKVTLYAHGLPRNWHVEAGLYAADTLREILMLARTDALGSLTVKLTLPKTARPGETWLGIVKVYIGDEFVFISSEGVAVRRAGFTYRVRAGDTLGEIAGWFNTHIEDILMVNPDIQRSGRIYVGQELAIPINTTNNYQPFLRWGYRIPDYQEARWELSIARGVMGQVWEEIQAGERWIEVDISAQLVRAYQGFEPVRLFLASTGRARTPTVTGKYYIYVKHRYTDMSGPGYHLEDVPYTMYFYQGYGLHGAYWHQNFGRPMSHGCVNLSVEDAGWLFDFAEVGTLVYIHE